jgi:hypothetical protein
MVKLKAKSVEAFQSTMCIIRVPSVHDRVPTFEYPKTSMKILIPVSSEKLDHRLVH